MTDHNMLYNDALKKLKTIPDGKFRFANICDNPPTRLGRRFRDDVVKHKRFSDVKCIGADSRSTIYEKYKQQEDDVEF